MSVHRQGRTLRKDSNLLECRVVELVLVATGGRRPHTLVGPQTGEGVAQEGKQHLILVKAATAGQDRVGVNLQEKINKVTKQMGKWWQNIQKSLSTPYKSDELQQLRDTEQHPQQRPLIIFYELSGRLKVYELLAKI